MLESLVLEALEGDGNPSKRTVERVAKKVRRRPDEIEAVAADLEAAGFLKRRKYAGTGSDAGTEIDALDITPAGRDELIRGG
jgi:hypothetical protein